jgi:fructosamine-3-kinase
MTNTETATQIVRKNMDSSLSIVSIEPLHGGMVNKVEKWLTNGSPSAIVAKVSDKQKDNKLESEFKSMRWFQKNTSFPIPEPYAFLNLDQEQPGTYLLMEFISANNLSRATLTFNGMQQAQSQLADILIELHSHTRDTYGLQFESSGPKRWLDIFEHEIEQNFIKSKSHIEPQSRQIIKRMLENIDELIP